MRWRILSYILALCMMLAAVPAIPLWAAGGQTESANVIVSESADEAVDENIEEVGSVGVTVGEDADEIDNVDETGGEMPVSPEEKIDIPNHAKDAEGSDAIKNIQSEAAVTVDETDEPNARATDVPMSGSCGKDGDNVKWRLEPYGAKGEYYKLIIGGTGEMAEYSGYYATIFHRIPAPWDKSNAEIKTIVIENGVTSIGSYAFYRCRNLINITIPNSIISIGGYAFYGCDSLTEIGIPKSVTSIKSCAFGACRNLEGISVDYRNTTYSSSENGILFNKQKTELIWCKSRRRGVYNIPNGVERIASCAFFGCYDLTGLNIPNSVTYIAYDAFYHTDLKDIYYKGDEASWKNIKGGIIGEMTTDGYLRIISSIESPQWAWVHNANIHYNSTGGSEWNSSLFERTSTKYNVDLARIAADMSEKSEDGENAIKDLYHSYNFDAYECFFGDLTGASFAIGHDTITINGIDTTILVITARGTKNFFEAIGDWTKGGKRGFLGEQVWNNAYKFEEKLWRGIEEYVDKYNINLKKHLKILISGHSLGGAAANMVGARFTQGIKDKNNWWNGKVTMDDIYVYTFGTIKVLTEEKNISDGYKNIHNIYNYYDSYGPKGVQYSYGISSFNAKFGHMHLYSLKYDEGDIIIPFFTCENHNMSNYKEALERNLVNDCEAFVRVNDVKITGSFSEIAVGKKLKLKVAVSPTNATNKSVTWKSSNTKYATVNNKGIVTIKKAAGGKTVTITATAKDGSGIKASYKIQCMKGIVKKVTISGKKTRTIKAGKSIKLKAKVKATKGANKTLKWSSSNTKYAKVNNKGKVTTKKAGKGKTIKITATATDGSKKRATVKIVIGN